MKRYINIFLWVLFLGLMAPSGMVLASWDSVPGDSTYSWKISMEKSLLAVIPSGKIKTSTHSKLTERRLGEVTRILSGRQASAGLDNLSAQIVITKDSLHLIKNAKERQVAVEKYIQTLNQVSNQLEQEKVTRAVAYVPTQPTQIPDNNYRIPSRRTPTPPTIAPTTTPTNPPITPVPSVPDAEDVIDEETIDEIDETQEEINDIIDELEDIKEEAEEEVKEEEEENIENFNEAEDSGLPAMNAVDETPVNNNAYNDSGKKDEDKDEESSSRSNRGNGNSNDNNEDNDDDDDEHENDDDDDDNSGEDPND